MLIAKYAAVVALILFTSYTIYCSRTENFFKSCKTVFSLKWGRQVVTDLYLGLFLFLFLVYLKEASFTMFLVWAIPTLIFGNIVPLIYFVIYFQDFVRAFQSLA